MYTFETQTTNVLIIGASGRTGNYIVEALIKQSKEKEVNVNISAFCRTPKTLDGSIRQQCSNVIQGDARNSNDLDRALKLSKADIVVVSVGNGDDVSKTDIRTSSAQALVDVLQQHNRRYQHVKVVVVSSIGAGSSRIKAGFGIGLFIEHHLRHILHDHSGQELAFLSDPSIQERTMIVRPTALTEGESSASEDGGTAKMVTFGDGQKCPTMKTDRKDLAEFVAKQILFEETIRFGSKPMNITVVKRH